MKRLWTVGVGWLLCLAAGRAGAEAIEWRAIPAETDRPAVTLLPPRPREGSEIQPASFDSNTAPDPLPVVRAQNPDPLYSSAGSAAVLPPGGPALPPPPPPYPAGLVVPPENQEKLFCGVVANSGGGGQGFLDQGKQALGAIPDALTGNGSRCLFQSDHCFDNFISPVSNPFLAQDPRSLTEIKPLLLYQQIPGSNPVFHGGDAWFYGVQGSLAVTDQFSIIVNKLGFMTLRPNDQAAGATNSTGFAESMFGPQFTFIRNENTGTLLAAGLTFDVAWGDNRVFQDTGDLSLIPYVSFGQNFLKSSFGSFNFLDTTGYSFGVTDRRNDFFYSSFHLDYDVGNLHKIYPLVELNWTQFTTNGSPPRFYGFDGGDLINFGNGGVAGHTDLSLALGARYKFAEWFQVGAAVEAPLVERSQGFSNYRLQLDLIFRY